MRELKIWQQPLTAYLRCEWPGCSFHAEERLRLPHEAERLLCERYVKDAIAKHEAERIEKWAEGRFP